MVKVIIERDEKRKELTGDLVMGTVARFHDDGTDADTFINGEGNLDKVVNLLLNTIPCILERVSKSKLDYIEAMMTLSIKLDNKIKNELKENAESVAEMLKNL